jgi:hypothetical protein
MPDSLCGNLKNDLALRASRCGPGRCWPARRTCTRVPGRCRPGPAGRRDRPTSCPPSAAWCPRSSAASPAGPRRGAPAASGQEVPAPAHAPAAARASRPTAARTGTPADTHNACWPSTSAGYATRPRDTPAPRPDPSGSADGNAGGDWLARSSPAADDTRGWPSCFVSFRVCELVTTQVCGQLFLAQGVTCNRAKSSGSPCYGRADYQRRP